MHLANPSSKSKQLRRRPHPRRPLTSQELRVPHRRDGNVLVVEEAVGDGADLEGGVKFTRGRGCEFIRARVRGRVGACTYASELIQGEPLSDEATDGLISGLRRLR
jgi:hypothetical protein